MALDQDSPGCYRLKSNLAVTEESSIEGNVKKVCILNTGTLINVVEVVHPAECDPPQIRGRLDNPKGWISLRRITDDACWAVKELAVGVRVLVDVLAFRQKSEGRCPRSVGEASLDMRHGRVACRNEDDTYDVDSDDGARWSNVPLELITPEDLPQQ
mmetsp:Transcript_71726/g.199012  ORF Transcript_71726/g.199012 Transcript_71726/m.199012 type:complete len:157 (+) Transcript_71726:2-472(+)